MPAMPGQKVKTNSPLVMKAREGVCVGTVSEQADRRSMELILAVRRPWAAVD